MYRVNTNIENERAGVKVTEVMHNRVPAHMLNRSALSCRFRSSVPTLSLLAYKSTLCDDQTGPGPLGVILNHQLIRDLSRVLSPRARQRSHHDAILEFQIA